MLIALSAIEMFGALVMAVMREKEAMLLFSLTAAFLIFYWMVVQAIRWSGRGFSPTSEIFYGSANLPTRRKFRAGD